MEYVRDEATFVDSVTACRFAPTCMNLLEEFEFLEPDSNKLNKVTKVNLQKYLKGSALHKKTKLQKEMVAKSAYLPTYDLKINYFQLFFEEKKW